MRYFLLWLVLHLWLPSFYGIFRIWEKICKNTCYNFFAIISLALLPSRRFNLDLYFRLLCRTPLIEMPSLNRNEKVICRNCGTQTTKLNLARHKKKCSVGTLYCTQCPNFSTKSQNDLNYQIAKKHSAQNLISPSSVNFAFKSFQDFTLYVNIETLNTECITDQEQEMWMWNIWWEMLRITD